MGDWNSLIGRVGDDCEWLSEMVRNSLKKCRKDDTIVDISERYNHPEDKAMPITGGMARIGELLFTLPLHVIATLRICRTLLRLVFFNFLHLGGERLFSMQNPILVDFLV